MEFGFRVPLFRLGYVVKRLGNRDKALLGLPIPAISVCQTGAPVGIPQSGSDRMVGIDSLVDFRNRLDNGFLIQKHCTPQAGYPGDVLWESPIFSDCYGGCGMLKSHLGLASLAMNDSLAEVSPPASVLPRERLIAIAQRCPAMAITLFDESGREIDSAS